MPINLLGSTSGYTQIVAAAVAGNNTLTLPTTTGNLLTDNGSGSLSLSGNLAFTGTGNRITGDFSNATVASRVMFQSSTTNGVTLVSTIPNGTATNSQVQVFNASDPTNASLIKIAALGSSVGVYSDITGTGTYLPLTMYTGGSERLRIDTSGNVGIGASSSGSKLYVNGGITSAAIGSEGGEINFNNPDNLSTGLVVDVSTANNGRVYGTANNFNLQIGQLGGTGGSVVFYTAGAERFRAGPLGQFGVGATPSYGTSGQVLTSGGASAAPSWATISALSQTAFSNSGSDAATSGYFQLSNGFVLQWAYKTSAGDLNYTFPLAFTHVYGAVTGSNTSGGAFLRIQSLSNTAMVVSNANANIAGWVLVYGTV